MSFRGRYALEWDPSEPTQSPLNVNEEQNDQVVGERGTTQVGTTFETPEESESLAKPAEERVGSKDREGLFPSGKPAGEEQEGKGHQKVRMSFFKKERRSWFAEVEKRVIFLPEWGEK